MFIYFLHKFDEGDKQCLYVNSWKMFRMKLSTSLISDSFSLPYVKISYDENLRQKRFTLQNYRKRQSTLI